MSEIYQCQICSKVFRSKSSISKHERQLHPNNRIVPHGFLLGIASQEDFEKYRSAFIFRLKKTLSFDIKKTGQKTLFIETFSERLFVNFFCGEQTFRYKSYSKMYSCTFSGWDGCKKIGEILDKTDWYERRHPDPNLLTTSYVLMQEQEIKYEVVFGWKLKNYIDTDETLYVGNLFFKYQVVTKDVKRD